MAIYSTSVKPISRSAGRSATAAAAYRLGCVIHDARQGLTHNYRRRSGVAEAFNFAPTGLLVPSAAKLWNAAEHHEKRKNSTVAREVLVALPHELSEQQRSQLTRAIAQELADRYRVAGSTGIHLPDGEGDNRNHHAHIQITTREYQADGSLGAKTRVLDDQKTGPEEVRWIRQMVEDKTNESLALAGQAVRVSCKSLEDQKVDALERGNAEEALLLDRLPTVHEGPAVTQIRREMKRHGRDSLAVVDRIVENDYRELVKLNKVIDFMEAKARFKLRREVERKQVRLQTIGEDIHEAQSSLNAAKNNRPEAPDGYVEYLAAVSRNNALFKSKETRTKFESFLSIFGVKPAAARAYENARIEMLTHYARDESREYREWLKSWADDIKEKSGALEKLKAEQNQAEKLVKENQHVLPKREKPDIHPESVERSVELKKTRIWKRDLDNGLGYG